jgi:hypothetical protein
MDRNSNEMGLVAYNFEPEYSEEEMTSRSQQHSIADVMFKFPTILILKITDQSTRSLQSLPKNNRPIANSVKHCFKVADR